MSANEDFFSGWMLFRSNASNFDRGIAHMERAASRDHAGALFFLGMGYLKGSEGFEGQDDEEKGFMYLRRAANLGYSPAMHVLGHLSFGRDDRESLDWFSKAVDLDKSCGIGANSKSSTSEDVNTWAITLKSFGIANFHLSKLYFKAATSRADLTVEEVNKNDTAGYETLKAAAYVGIPDACYQLAKLYLPPLDNIEEYVLKRKKWDKKLVEKSSTYRLPEATELLLCASRSGFNKAQYALGMILEIGLGDDHEDYVGSVNSAF